VELLREENDLDPMAKNILQEVSWQPPRPCRSETGRAQQVTSQRDTKKEKRDTNDKEAHTATTGGLVKSAEKRIEGRGKMMLVMAISKGSEKGDTVEVKKGLRTA